ncbi:MAG: ribosome small subunit-dependent GTPase A [Chitinophagaceae bacterium]|nr:ribosome small subunit-dependent GTPase A [Chitinophagaceae bacterium]
MKATVYKSTGSWYTVKDESGQWRQARIKGIFKLDDITSTNPVVVGDLVEIEPEDEEKLTAVITHIYPRQNYINRQSPRHKKHQHIIASNLDQSILLVTLRQPRTQQGFIDRFLIVSEMYKVPSVIVFNKSDLYSPEDMELYEKWRKMYEGAGYPVLLISVKTGSGMERVHRLLHHKTTLLSGHSGVGKSSFLNVLLPHLHLKTEQVSLRSGKGKHTTTFAQMFDLPDGGRIIDTPGVKEFGLIYLKRAELSHYFPEMKSRLINCRFNNCLHIKEPECAVRHAVENGEITSERYESYLAILETIEEADY